jgi:diguanylate cyclase (GGDEF)-like protein
MPTCSSAHARSAFLLIIYARDSSLLGRGLALGPPGAVVTVGRHGENTIVLNSDGTSRRHARFEEREDGWWVVDTQSTNGTYVNDEPVTSAPVRCGDHIKIGGTIFKGACGGCRPGLVDAQRWSSEPDGLTGAHPRRELVERLDRELRGAERPGRPLALVVFDLDDFKRVNDAHGHLAGDHVLREVASLVRRHLRPDDVFARYGGDELALMLPGTDLQGGAALAEKIRLEVAAHAMVFEGQAIQVTLSAGVAQAGEGSVVAHDLIRPAEEALREAKRAGGDRVRLREPRPAPRPVSALVHTALVSATDAQKRMVEYLGFDDERPFIHKAWDQTLDDEDRLRYAEVVERRDPERAEWLRLEVALHARATDDPAVLARFRELAWRIGLDYANQMLREKILNCGSAEAKEEPPRVRFAFACSKRWETLAPTDAEAVRFCQQCSERVYHCDTVEEAASRALAGQCIAVPKPLTDGGVESHSLGKPDPLGDWAWRLFPGGRR